MHWAVWKADRHCCWSILPAVRNICFANAQGLPFMNGMVVIFSLKWGCVCFRYLELLAAWLKTGHKSFITDTHIWGLACSKSVISFQVGTLSFVQRHLDCAYSFKLLCFLESFLLVSVNMYLAKYWARPLMLSLPLSSLADLGTQTQGMFRLKCT